MSMMPKMLDMAFRKYILPIVKGESKMKKAKNAPNAMPMFPGMMPPMPFMPPTPSMPPVPPMPGAFPWDWNGNVAQQNVKAKKKFKSNAKKAWKKSLDMQKATVDSAKTQYKQFFSYMMDMQDYFASFMPDQVPTMPGMPAMPACAITPKSFMKAMKKFEKMSNDHFIEQTDSVIDFFFEGQQLLIELEPKAPQAAAQDDEEEEVIEVEAEVNDEELDETEEVQEESEDAEEE